MAARSHVDVSERRLRPVYDCLDSGNNKKALQEADKVLKKQRDCLCAKVLKALALIRLGRQADANVYLDEVVSQNPTEDSTLSAMTICYKELQSSEKIVTIYENAHIAAPDNEEILTSLFMGYVRVGDYRKQQQTALKLNKLQPHKNPYYFWGVMSVVLQAQENGKLGKTVYLPLARKMTEKYVNGEKIDAEAEVFLYLMILDMLEDHETALQVIQGPLGDKITSDYGFKSVKAIELLTKLERWPEVNAASRKLLIENPDNWQYYLQYFKSFFLLLEEGWKQEDHPSSELTVDSSVSAVSAFLEEQVVKNNSRHPLRGPYLAKMEFYKQLSACGNNSVAEMDFYGMVKGYFEMFSSKNCCFSDLKPYVELLGKDETQKLIDEFTELTSLQEMDGKIKFATDIKQLQSHICVCQLSRYLGLQNSLSTEEKKSLAQQLVARYQDALQFGGDLLSTDLQYGDNYLLMAIHILADVWRDSGDDGMLWQMIVLLEGALKSSPCNFQMKILLINFYCTLGAFGPCPLIYDGMEIKNIQNDTLGYIITNHVCRLGNMMSASIVYGNMLRFFTVNHKEITEQLTTSYKYGSFCKIIEFIKFRERLQNSLQYAISTAERLLIDLTLDVENLQETEDALAFMAIDPVKDKTNWEELADNRDLGFLLSWDQSSRCGTQEVKEKSFNEEKAWLALRNLTLRTLAASVLISKQGRENTQQNNGATEDMVKILTDLVVEMETLVKENKSYSEPTVYPVQGPFRTRISWYLKDGHGTLFTDMLRIVLYMAAMDDRGDNTEEDMEDKITNLPNRLSDLVKESLSSLSTEDSSKKHFQPTLLERLVLVSETISHVTVLAGVCNRILKPVKAAIAKRRKKKKDLSVSTPTIFTSYDKLLKGLDEASHQLIDAIKLTHPSTSPVDISTLSLVDNTLNMPKADEIEKDVLKKVETSYQETTRELTDFIKKKINYLKSIKLS